MLDTDTKRRIDTCRDILVGKVPDPKSQVEQITIALIYKFMDDMDSEAEALGGKRSFFTGDFAKYAWTKLMAPNMGGFDVLSLYSEAIGKMNENPGVPALFRDIFKNAYLPYRDPETLRSFLKEINGFSYDHSERLGDAFEYLLSVLGSQGDAGQFRTPRHIIDFMVEITDPKKDETILDPACGTAGFLISSYKHILKHNTSKKRPLPLGEGGGEGAEAYDEKGVPLEALTLESPLHYKGDLLTPDDRKRLAANIHGYDISPDMVRLSLVNMYLHGFTNPHIDEYDTLTSDEKWNELADVILANPPFMSPKGGIKPHKRFSIDAKRSEVLFVDYMAEHLTPNGRAAIVVPEGIIFQSQTAYKHLRKLLVENYLVAVVSLPAGVFNPYSGVKTSILILDKRLAKKSDSIAFFKIENDGYGLGAQRRPIDKNDLPAAVETFKAFRHSRESRNPVDFDPAHYRNVLVVEKTRIAVNGEYNLSGERYREGAASNHSFPLVFLGDSSLFRVESGGTPKSDVETYWNGGIPWATLVDLPATDFITQITTTQRTISELGLRESSAKMIPANSVIVSTRATIGRIAINCVPIATNQGFKNVVIEDSSQAVPEYVALALTKLVPTMDAWATGGTFKEISKSKFCELQIPLPPLEVQKEIVAEIEGYQKVINGARAVLDHYRPHIPIHPDWPMVEFDEVVFFQEGPGIRNWQFTSSGIKLLNVKNIVGDRVVLDNSDKHISEEEFAAKYSHFLVEDGDIILASSGATYGKNAFFRDPGFRVMVNTSNIRLHPKDKERIIQGYIKIFLDSPLFKIQIDRLITGAAQPNFGPSHLKQVKIPLPPLATQQAIVAEIKAEQALVAANRELIARFEQKIQATLARVWGES